MQCCASTAVATGTAKKMLWLAGLACALAWARAAAAVEMDRPQYICLNGIGGNQNSQAAITSTIANLSGVTKSADGRRRLCMSDQFSVLQERNATALLEQVRLMLSLSLANDLPVSFSIDATQWWGGREDLFNFWNSTRNDTYNPENVYNVEWTWWSPANATEISWRNWGSQFRIDGPAMYTPAPNFASPAFRKAAQDGMLPLVKEIAAWYADLPSNKKYLLAYVRSTQELWQGANYWYYPNGNALAKDKNTSHDPRLGPSGGMQLGYAAACIAGAQCSGDITVAQIDKTINDYCTFSNALVTGAGIPRSRVMCHTGTRWNGATQQPTPPPPPGAKPKPIFNTPAAAITTTGSPAWSMYIADNSDKGSMPTHTLRGLNESLDATDGTPWGAPEWMPFSLIKTPAQGGRGTPVRWDYAFEDILSYRNNRLVVMQNWDSLWQNDGLATDPKISFVGIHALQRALSKSLPCLVDAPTGMQAQRINASAFKLQWTPGKDADTQSVLASAAPGLVPSGALAAPTMLSMKLAAGEASATLLLEDDFQEVVYWQVVARGCMQQTAVGDVVLIYPHAPPTI